VKRGQTYTELYRKLYTKDKNDVYNIVKLWERKTRYFNQVRYIKNETDRLLLKDDEIKNGLRDYFDKPFNEELESTMIELDDLFDDTDR
jgi:hypothetical protein